MVLSNLAVFFAQKLVGNVWQIAHQSLPDMGKWFDFQKVCKKLVLVTWYKPRKLCQEQTCQKSWKINKIWIFWSQKSQIKGKCKFKLQFKIQIKQLAYIHNWENNTSRHLQATLPTNIIKLFKNNTVKKGQAKNIDLVLSWHIK